MNDHAYLYWEGLTKLASEITGHERILMGIRPYGFHAGNTLSLLAYPYLLCEYLRSKGVEPHFKFLISINDWEQSDLSGKDIYTFPFDVEPKHTTLAHAAMTDSETMADYWQPRIEEQLSVITRDFPGVSMEFVRNSALKTHPKMHQAIFDTLKNYREHKQILLSQTGVKTVGNDTRFCNVLCETCLGANTDTTIINDNLLKMTCQECGITKEVTYEDSDFWLYYKQIFPARMACLNFDLVISGSDHYLAKTFETSKTLYEYIYKEPMPKIKMLFAPLVIAGDGNKMSKSRGNMHDRNLNQMLNLARGNGSESILVSF